MALKQNQWGWSKSKCEWRGYSFSKRNRDFSFGQSCRDRTKSKLFVNSSSGTALEVRIMSSRWENKCYDKECATLRRKLERPEITMVIHPKRYLRTPPPPKKKKERQQKKKKRNISHIVRYSVGVTSPALSICVAVNITIVLQRTALGDDGSAFRSILRLHSLRV